MHHEVKKHFFNVDVPHIIDVLYGSSMCGHGGEHKVCILQYLVQTAGWYVIECPYVVRFLYQEKLGEAEEFFPTADIILPPHLR